MLLPEWFIKCVRVCQGYNKVGFFFYIFYKNVATVSLLYRPFMSSETVSSKDPKSLPSLTLVTHTQHSCIIKLIKMCPVFTVQWFLHAVLIYSHYRCPLNTCSIYVMLLNLCFLSMICSSHVFRVCFSSTDAPRLWWGEDGHGSR